MGDPRGLIQREVLGKTRRLRARLSFPADYKLRTGQSLSDFLGELEQLGEDPLAYDADHLLGAICALCEGAGDPVADEELEEATLGDMIAIIQAINDALVESGLMKIAEEAAGGAKKKKKAPSKSRGRTGKKSRSAS